MSSLLTNSAAMTALQTLNMTNKNMDITQSRISTGMRVSTAADNAAYWSIATTMRSDDKALGAVQDALGLGAATVDIAYTGMEQVIEIAKEIVAKVTAAGTPGVDLNKIQSEIDQLTAQIGTIRDSANFNGVNWLDASSVPVSQEIVTSFTRSGASVVLQTVAFDTATSDIDTIFADFLSVDVASFTDPANDAGALLATLDTNLNAATNAATELGALKNRIGLQQDFVKALRDSIDRGIGQLVDADMNAESTRLQALQVQQQLGIQALSIANQNSQNILSLFR
jgi:flagellin